MRKYTGLFLVLAALMTCGAFASDVFPGAVFLANNDAGDAGKWTTALRIMAPLTGEAKVDEFEGVQIGPKVYLTAKDGGAAAIAVTRAGFNVISAPSEGEIVSALRYEHAGHVTAFTMRRVPFRFDNTGDRMRYGPFSNSGGGSVTITASADKDSIMTAFVYDKDGHAVDVFYVNLAGHELAQATYDKPLDAFTVQIVPVCVGFGPCPGPANSFLIATNSFPAATVQTIEVSYGQNIGTSSLAFSNATEELELVRASPPDLVGLAKRIATVTPEEAAAARAEAETR